MCYGACGDVPVPSGVRVWLVAESDLIIGVVRARSVHEVGYGHNGTAEGDAETGCGGRIATYRYEFPNAAPADRF
jgi:hypothetical protein